MPDISEDSKPVSQVLREVASIDDSDEVTLFEVKSALHGRVFGILTIIFSLPLSIPIPVPPGYTTIFSIPLILFSMQLLLGHSSPWLPKWLENKPFKRSTLSLIIQKISPILEKIEKMIKPRMHFVFYGPGEKILAFIMLLCAISIAIPLPFIHFIPAIGTTLISLGMMNKDGLLSILGVVASMLGSALTLAVIIVGPKLIVEAFYFLKGLL